MTDLQHDTNHQHDTKATEPDDGPSYEAPVVEDLETVDGPAVTAAGKTTVE